MKASNKEKMKTKMRVGVKVMPREVILDTQGRALQQTLLHHEKQVENCRVGKYIELTLEGNAEEVQVRAKEIAEFILHNPLIETYEIQILNQERFR